MTAIVTTRANTFDVVDASREATIGYGVDDPDQARRIADEYNLPDLLERIAATLHDVTHAGHAVEHCPDSSPFMSQANALHHAGLLPTRTEYSLGAEAGGFEPCDESRARGASIGAHGEQRPAFTRLVGTWKPLTRAA